MREMALAPEILFERLWDKTEPIPFSGCWVFLGALTDGYGITGIGGGKTRHVHLAAYEILRGPVPAGLVLDHLCRVRPCWNPDHLEPTTHRINILRGNGATARHAVKTACPQGHPYSGTNLYIAKSGDRHCRECMRARAKARRAVTSPKPTKHKIGTSLPLGVNYVR